jgi:UDPglucose 6-dehydrogenase
MKLAVVGTGYVGLVTGACFAEHGNDVVCVDQDEAKVRLLRRGQIPIHEPGLEELVRRNGAEKRLVFTTSLASAVRKSAVVFIAVGPPPGEDGSADLPQVLSVARDIARAMNGYKVVVGKSTVPVGTSDRVREIIRRETTHPFSVVSNPEFLKQGAAVEDAMKPDRVVIGVEDDRARDVMVELYGSFTRTGAPIMVMDCASAELCKYAANAMLATRISFMNEVARVCEACGADVDQVRLAMGADRRIGPSFLFPGIGYGGSCFPKDVKALMRSAADRGYTFRILQAVEEVNLGQKRLLVDKMERHFGSLDGRTVAVWGLSFKPNTDDMRESPSIEVIEGLLAGGARVQAYDPVAMRVARGVFGNRVVFARKSYDALSGADALALVHSLDEALGLPLRPFFEALALVVTEAYCAALRQREQARYREAMEKAQLVCTLHPRLPCLFLVGDPDLQALDDALGRLLMVAVMREAPAFIIDGSGLFRSAPVLASVVERLADEKRVTARAILCGFAPEPQQPPRRWPAGTLSPHQELAEAVAEAAALLGLSWPTGFA